MSSGLLLAILFVLLIVAIGLLLLVGVAVLGLLWVRRARSERAPAEAEAAPEPTWEPPPALPPVSAAPRGPASQAPAPRKSVPPPFEEAPRAKARPSKAPAPMLGFFDDETSTGAQGRPGGGLGGGLMALPPSALSPLDAQKSPMIGDEEESEEGATEIFSAGQVSAEFAALLEEPDEGTPPPAARRR